LPGEDIVGRAILGESGRSLGGGLWWKKLPKGGVTKAGKRGCIPKKPPKVWPDEKFKGHQGKCFLGGGEWKKDI